MEAQPRSGSRGLLVELAVVFLGVLIALAADGWRESLVEASREREYLESLRADMQQAVSNMGVVEALLSQRIDEVDGFLALVSSTRPVPDSVLALRLTTSNAVVPTGTLDALVQGGTIELIDDARLRSQILGSRAEINSWLGVLDRQAAFFEQSHAEYTKLEEVVRYEEGLPRGAIPFRTLAGRPEVLGVYTNQRNHLVNRRYAVVRLRESAAELLRALANR